MDIRSVESLPTNGILNKADYRLSLDTENITLDYDDKSGTLAVIDSNINYTSVPQVNSTWKKKVFLTYNGYAKNNYHILETVVMQSDPAEDPDFKPGFANSSMWLYSPRELSYPTEILSLTDPQEFKNKPYDYSQGYTVVKNFLTANANGSSMVAPVTAFFRAPTLTNFIPANYEHNKIHVDGWYTSYVIAVKPYSTGGDYATGDIVWFEDEFHVSKNGVTDMTEANWRAGATLDDFKAALNVSIQNEGAVTSNLFFAETQHLVTIELSKAILQELYKQSMCEPAKYQFSNIALYLKLYQKRLGAWAKFQANLFHDAQAILATARSISQKHEQ